MIARELPLEEPRPRTGTRAGRSAVSRRRARTWRLRYAGLYRMFATAGALTVAVVFYLALMANVTRMNYELTRSVREKAELVDRAARLEDRIAQLDSRERLAKIAAHLGLREPETFAQIVLPPPRPQAAPRGIAFLHWLR